MTRSELIATITEAYPHLRRAEAERAVNSIFAKMSEALSRGGRVELRGFGTLALKKRNARIARNPKTRIAVAVGERYITSFRTGKDLRHRLNGRD